MTQDPERKITYGIAAQQEPAESIKLPNTFIDQQELYRLFAIDTSWGKQAYSSLQTKADNFRKQGFVHAFSTRLKESLYFQLSLESEEMVKGLKRQAISEHFIPLTLPQLAILFGMQSQRDLDANGQFFYNCRLALTNEAFFAAVMERLLRSLESFLADATESYILAAR